MAGLESKAKKRREENFKKKTDPENENIRSKLVEVNEPLNRIDYDNKSAIISNACRATHFLSTSGK